eukprot:5754803-Alexandrium_andersonii.AAC.1
MSGQTREFAERAVRTHLEPASGEPDQRAEVVQTPGHPVNAQRGHLALVATVRRGIAGAQSCGR